ncbi:hypothetical protein EAF04_004364 [Stromatinia cepivora]|nr:hypothetical protein EAF04_004364 [Stromatinia cepivora]
MYTSLGASGNSETHLSTSTSESEVYTSQYGRTSSPERSLIENGESTSTLSPSPENISPESKSIDLKKPDMLPIDPDSKKRGWRFFGSFACLAILNLVCAVDVTILSVALPTIATSLHATAIQAFWCGRCIQGIGGGGLVGLTYALLADMVTLRERGKWMSIISLQWAIGSVISPVIGGSMWVKLKTFDWLGSFLFVASTTSLLIPITWGGVMYSWSSVRTLVPLLIGVGGLIASLLYSIFRKGDPLIRRSLLNSPTAIVAYFGTTRPWHLCLVRALLHAIMLRSRQKLHPNPSWNWSFPLTFTTAPAAVVVRLIIAETGHYRPSIWAGWALTTLGLGLLILLKESTSTVSWIFINLIPGIGLGTLFSAQGFVTQASASNADPPFAGAMYSFFRAFGQTISVWPSPASYTLRYLLDRI